MAQQLTRAGRLVNEGSTATVKLQYLDGDGVPLTATNISAATLTLKDRRTGAVINSRNAENVLNANGGDVPSDLVITAATKANPCEVTFSTTHRLEDSQRVYITGVGGMTEINSKVHRVFKVSDTVVALADVDSSEYGAYTSGGSARTGLLIQTLSPADNAIVGISISGATQAEPVVLTFSAAHELHDGAVIRIESVGGMTELNGRRFRVKRSAYNAVELVGENGSAYTAYTSGGVAVPDLGEVEPHLAIWEITHLGGTLKSSLQLDVEQLI